jgi:hypothetical protein
MFTLFGSRIVRAVTFAALATTLGASTAMAGAPTHGRPTRQLKSVLTLDNVSADLDIQVTFEGTPPRPGSREEAAVLFSIKSDVAKWALEFIDGLWGGDEPASVNCPVTVDASNNSGTVTIEITGGVCNSQ